jgi:2-polyprenyl-6-methoxyphenol hydroxylase-like FAD-dependent oxidoreductase
MSPSSYVLSAGSDMKAIIVGGGVGGLTTALMLHARGIDCEVYEQADTVRELGVGINTLPTRSRNWPISGCWSASTRSRSGPTN